MPQARSLAVAIAGRGSFRAAPAAPGVLVMAPRLAIVRRCYAVGTCQMGGARLTRVALVPPPLQACQPRIIDRSSSTGLSQCQGLTPTVE